MKREFKNLLVGIFIGLINCICYIFSDVMDISLFISVIINWVVIAFFVDKTKMKLKGGIKGIVISLLIACIDLPFYITEGISAVIWTFITTAILGMWIGRIIDKKKKDTSLT